MLMQSSQPIRIRRRHLHNRASRQRHFRLSNGQTCLCRPHPHGLHLGWPRPPTPDRLTRKRHPPQRRTPTYPPRLRPLHDGTFLPFMLGHTYPTQLRPKRRAGQASPRRSREPAESNLRQDWAGVSYVAEGGRAVRDGYGCGDGRGVFGCAVQHGSEVV